MPLQRGVCKPVLKHLCALSKPMDGVRIARVPPAHPCHGTRFARVPPAHPCHGTRFARGLFAAQNLKASQRLGQYAGALCAGDQLQPKTRTPLLGQCPRAGRDGGPLLAACGCVRAQKPTQSRRGCTLLARLASHVLPTTQVRHEHDA